MPEVSFQTITINITWTERAAECPSFRLLKTRIWQRIYSKYGWRTTPSPLMTKRTKFSSSNLPVALTNSSCWTGWLPKIPVCTAKRCRQVSTFITKLSPNWWWMDIVSIRIFFVPFRSSKGLPKAMHGIRKRTLYMCRWRREKSCGRRLKTLPYRFWATDRLLCTSTAHWMPPRGLPTFRLLPDVTLQFWGRT